MRALTFTFLLSHNIHTLVTRQPFVYCKAKSLEWRLLEAVISMVTMNLL